MNGSTLRYGEPWRGRGFRGKTVRYSLRNDFCLTPSRLRELWNIQRAGAGWQSDMWLCGSGETTGQIQYRGSSVERPKGMALPGLAVEQEGSVPGIGTGGGRGSHSRNWEGTVRVEEGDLRENPGFKGKE